MKRKLVYGACAAFALPALFQGKGLASPTVEAQADPTALPGAAPGDAQTFWDTLLKSPLLAPQNLPFLIGGAALVVVVLVTVLFVLRSRKKRNKANNKPASVTLAPAVGSAPSAKGAPSAVPVVGNLHNIGSYETQQDAFGISSLADPELLREKGVLAVLADGISGLPNGKEISQMAVRNMLRLFASTPAQKNGAATLLHLLEATNHAINEWYPAPRSAGTTMIAALLHRGEMHFVSVGDSRLCLVRGGAFIQMNRQHTYGAELDERAAGGSLSFDKAQSDPQRKAVTSFLGMGELKHVDRTLYPIALLPGDQVVLMTDGVYNTLSDEEILQSLSAGAVEGAAKLEQAVLQKHAPSQDNFTAVILQV